MPALVLLFAILLLSSALYNGERNAQIQKFNSSSVSAAASNVIVYRNLVAAYAEANPTYVGTVADVSLSMPPWYSKLAGLSNYANAGKSYVFLINPMAGLVGVLAERTESINVGTNVGGVLVSPNSSPTSIVLPAQVPISALVIVQ